MANFKEYFKWEYVKQPWRIVAIIQWLLLKLFGIGIAYAEQVVWRMYRCPECIDNKKCEYCPCNVVGMMISPKGRCSNHRWPAMMSAKNWKNYKEFHGIRFFVFDHLHENDEHGEEVISMKRNEVTLLSEERENLKNSLEELVSLADNIRKDVSGLQDLYNEKRNIYNNWLTHRDKYEVTISEAINDMNNDMNKNVETEIIIEDAVVTLPDNITIENENDMNTPSVDWTAKRLQEQLNVPVEINLGKLNAGEGKNFNFSYKGLLNIEDVKSSCGCTTQKTEGKEIRGTLKPEKGKGIHKKTITVYLSQEQGSNYLYRTVKGNLIKDVRPFHVTTVLKYETV